VQYSVAVHQRAAALIEAAGNRQPVITPCLVLPLLQKMPILRSIPSIQQDQKVSVTLEDTAYLLKILHIY
jgi:hypothetical protein